MMDPVYPWSAVDTHVGYVDSDGFVLGAVGELSPRRRRQAAARMHNRVAVEGNRRHLSAQIARADTFGLTVVDRGPLGLALVDDLRAELAALGHDGFLAPDADRTVKPGRLSVDARRRYARALLAHHPTWSQPGWTSLYVVLTVGDDWPESDTTWRSWLTALGATLADWFGHDGYRLMWRLAWQHRRAPHWDTLIAVEADVTATEIAPSLARAWVEISGLHGSSETDRLQVTQRGVQALSDVGGVFGYVCREMGADKQHQAIAPHSVRRWFDWLGAQRLSVGCKHSRCVQVAGDLRRVHKHDVEDRWDRIRREFLPHWQPIAHPTSGEPIWHVPSIVFGAWAAWLIDGDWGPCSVQLARRRSSRRVADMVPLTDASAAPILDALAVTT